MKFNLKNDNPVLPGKGDFWTEYLNLILKNEVPEKNARWYLYWVKQFTSYMKDVPLGECTAKDVTGFLSHLSNNNKAETWQVEQARNALKLLYRDFLQVTWAAQKKENTPLSPPLTRGELKEDISNSKNQNYTDIFKKLQTEIRVRHYSIRTEQTYGQWVRRFMHFHNWGYLLR